MVSLNGCSLWDRLFPEDEKTPEALMSEGMNYFESGRYGAAAEAFQMIKDRYPYSKFAVVAELKLADAFYGKELFDEAFETYRDFERLHPKNPDVPYVVYQQGMCRFGQIDSIDRDQSAAFKAKDEFERLIKKFPGNEYARRARIKLRECYIYLAEHELYVGHFYFKMKDYRAAMGRYRYIIENYPDFGQYGEALEYLHKCREKLGLNGEDS